LRRCQPEDFATLKILICGAEKLPQGLARDFHKTFGVLPLEGYGTTELSPVVAVNLPDQVRPGVRLIVNKPGTIGRPIPGVAVRLVHPDRPEEVLPPDQEGLLAVFGPNVMKGYLQREELTRQVIHNGWYATGDLARIDGDGFVTITGKQALFAKIGGEMVPLERIEEELQSMLGTSERRLVVTCVPDEARGERLVVLFTSLENHDARRLAKGLGERGFPNLWIPAERDFFQVPELPILGSGKVDRRGVRELALNRNRV
jgi:acyl-[acyl-carrier-protein]-phospholipid O-acyltransferase/long-chain-fatty-acid--[acyl-carrier-protein] ligase